MEQFRSKQGWNDTEYIADVLVTVDPSIGISAIFHSKKSNKFGKLSFCSSYNPATHQNFKDGLHIVDMENTNNWDDTPEGIPATSCPFYEAPPSVNQVEAIAEKTEEVEVENHNHR